MLIRGGVGHNHPSVSTCTTGSGGENGDQGQTEAVAEWLGSRASKM